MKKFLGYLLTIIIALVAGAAIMYFMIKNLDNGEGKIDKHVTVTDTGIAEGIGNIYDAVVVVENYKKGKLVGIGSGFIYDEKGYIMTNHHVVEGASELKAVLMNGEIIEAKLIGSDEYADIAVIQIDKKYVHAVAKMGSSENTKVGDTVFTIGSPMSETYAGTVTRGILSGKDRMVDVDDSTIMKVMQTDAAINPGNSGGPLCNVNGEVIGINSLKIVQEEVEGIGFAIPIEDAKEYADMLVSGGTVKRPYLGIHMLDTTASYYDLRKYNISIDSSITSGVIVVEVDKNSPCEKAGIEAGDVIIKIGNYDITKSTELKFYLYKHKPGEEVEVKIIRGTSEKTMKVILGEN